jgi:hypothetical protein
MKDNEILEGGTASLDFFPTAAGTPTLSAGKGKSKGKREKRAKDSPAPSPDAIVSRSCLRNLLDSIHGSHAYFKPTKRFYEASGINHRRWAKLYRGDLSISIDELKRLCKALNVTFTAETFLRQLRLFE